MSLQGRMLRFLSKGLDQHDKDCPMPAKAILLNPSDHEELGWEEFRGVPLVPDDSVPQWRFRIQCDGSASGIEDEVQDWVAPQQPVEIPVGPAGPPAPGEPADDPFRRGVE